MATPALVVLVRFKSSLSFDEVMAIANERADEFRALTGLQQKYYVQDPQTGEYGGLYMWDSPESFEAYRQSELRASIAEAYRAEGTPRVDVLRVVMPLR
jgi:hypothetical protein